jgi:hypothetical protein
LIRNYDRRLESLCPPWIDRQREIRGWKRVKAGGDRSVDIRRAHHDERKQTRNCQRDKKFEETTEKQRAEVDHAKNKNTVSGVPEYLTAAVSAHACP